MNCEFDVATSKCIHCGFLSPSLYVRRNCPELRGKPININLPVYGPPRWITNVQRVQDIYKLASLIPSNVTAIAGIPRSGLTVASMISELLHLHLYSIHSDSGLQNVSYGWRLNYKADDGDIIIVDDTVASGKSLNRLMPTLHKIQRKYTVGVVYCSPHNAHLVNYYAELLPLPHYLEWNFFNSLHSHNIGVDFDGVLCYDRIGSPKYLPRKHRLKLICTGRMEQHRSGTEDWLHRYGITYDKLVMWSGNDQDRWINHGVARFKAQAYIESDADVFVESCKIQAKVIGDITKKRVICTDTGEIWN